MPSTTVHIPEAILAKIDAIVAEKGISRNRFIINACEESIKNDAGKWPGDFFEERLNDDELSLLAEGAAEMRDVIIEHRRNRKPAGL